jgi:hypothetical protein
MLLLTYLGIFAAYKNFEHDRLLVIATAIGLFNAITLILSGVFSEDSYLFHFIFSLLIFATWIPVLFTMNYMLFRRGGYERWISYYGFVLGGLNGIFVIFVLLIGTVDFGAIIEWISVFSFQSWALLVVLFIIWRHLTQST